MQFVILLYDNLQLNSIQQKQMDKNKSSNTNGTFWKKKTGELSSTACSVLTQNDNNRLDNKIVENNNSSKNNERRLNENCHINVKEMNRLSQQLEKENKSQLQISNNLNSHPESFSRRFNLKCLNKDKTQNSLKFNQSFMVKTQPAEPKQQVKQPAMPGRESRISNHSRLSVFSFFNDRRSRASNLSITDEGDGENLTKKQMQQAYKQITDLKKNMHNFKQDYLVQVKKNHQKMGKLHNLLRSILVYDPNKSQKHIGKGKSKKNIQMSQKHIQQFGNKNKTISHTPKIGHVETGKQWEKIQRII